MTTCTPDQTCIPEQSNDGRRGYGPHSSFLRVRFSENGGDGRETTESEIVHLDEHYKKTQIGNSISVRAVFPEFRARDFDSSQSYEGASRGSRMSFCRRLSFD